jgi:hypothetical protein
VFSKVSDDFPKSPSDLINGSSNSGAVFFRYGELIQKTGLVDQSEKLRDQMIWLANLTGREQRYFPNLRYGRWSESSALHVSQYVPAKPVSSQLSERSTSEIVAAVKDATRWVSASLHKRTAIQLPCLHRLVKQTTDRLLMLAANDPSNFGALNESCITVNSLKIPGPLNLLLETIAATRSLFLEVSNVSRLHGDFHLGNLLLGHEEPGRWWLIDPRGRFAGATEVFDNYYDWGKLFHDLYCLYNLSVRGDIIGKQTSPNSFYVSAVRFNEGRRVYDEIRQSILVLLDELEHAEGGLIVRKLLIYTGLLTLGVLPFHKLHKERSISLLCSGSIALYQGMYLFEEQCRELIYDDFLSFDC